MFTRKRIDIGLPDLAHAAVRCAWPGDRVQRRQRLERRWSPDAFAAFSVRSGFDLVLGALGLPRGSEVLVSAVNIKDMVAIVEHHGLVAVPIDLELGTLAPEPAAWECAVTERTRAILVAHLFGTRVAMRPLVDLARRRRLVLLEDCAQAFAGPQFTGDPASDVTMFSFGPIKTSTALGGALLCVRDPALLRRMRALEESRPVQPRRAFFTRLAKYAAIKLISDRPSLYGTIARACERAGVDHDGLIASMTRSFAGAELLEAIRRQPSAPLLALLDRRIATFGSEALERRAEAGVRWPDVFRGGSSGQAERRR